jgi:hypothetical protein
LGHGTIITAANEGVEKPKSDHPIQIGQSFF